MSALSSACERVPVVVRATHLTHVPTSTWRIAQANARRVDSPLYIVGCWPPHAQHAVGAPLRQHNRHEAPSTVHSIGLGGVHPACDPSWRERHLVNRRATNRLRHSQPIWAAVELLTAAAARHVLRPTCPGIAASGGPNASSGIRSATTGAEDVPTPALPRATGRGCTAFVIDPDVLLLPSSVTSSCVYYDAMRFDAVLAFGSPAARFASLDAALRATPLLQLMGNRHVSFLAIDALNALAQVSDCVHTAH